MRSTTQKPIQIADVTFRFFVPPEHGTGRIKLHYKPGESKMVATLSGSHVDAVVDIAPDFEITIAAAEEHAEAFIAWHARQRTQTKVDL